VSAALTDRISSEKSSRAAEFMSIDQKSRFSGSDIQILP
jgi:hypothetical protein